jgi:serine/threonine-protein kinase
VVRKLIELTNPRRVGPLGSSAPALLHAQIGDVEEAFSWLQRALDSHTRDLIYVKVEPAYDSLRGDPRFAQIQKRIGLPE